MPTFDTIAKELLQLDPMQAFYKASSNEQVKQWILETIKKRLYGVGMDGNSKELSTDLSKKGNGYYSKFTIAEKKKKNQKISNVTLKDTGSFYNSFRMQIKPQFFEILANFDKQGNHIGENFTQMYSKEADFEEAITKLNNVEMQELLFVEIYDLFLNEFRKQWRKI